MGHIYTTQFHTLQRWAELTTDAEQSQARIKVSVGPRHCTTVGPPSLTCVTCRPLRNAELFVSLVTYTLNVLLIVFL